MDIRVVGDSTNEELFDMLKGSMPPGIDIVSVEEPVYDPKHITFGEFDILFDAEKEADALKADIEDMLSKDELIVQKLGKKGRHKVLKDINLIEFVKDYKVSSMGDRVKVTITLPAGSVTNVNPSLLADEIQKKHEGISYTVIRKKLMVEDGTVFK
jgi:hypothetical protein